MEKREFVSISSGEVAALTKALHGSSEATEIIGEAMLYLLCGEVPSSPLSELFAYMIELTTPPEGFE